LIPLPVDDSVPAILAALERSRAVVITAAPGAGKTTRVPPALLDAGPLVLLQPRRVAARAIAERIAAERGWTLGREVGWQVRSDSRRGPDTRLLVITEGILTRLFQTDPLLSSFATVVLDEFHERSIHADLAIAFARQAWKARDDLRVVVMSATLDAGGVARFLDDCPVIDIPGTTHPIDVEYAPGLGVAEGALRALSRTSGAVLCFLPGAGEINRTFNELRSRVPDSVDLVPLHGGLDAEAQAAGVQPSLRRRVVIATNIAETSITVPDVSAVVDSGLHKVARYDATRGIDSLDVARITLDSADQRAGRAGRTRPGIALRLWDSRDRLRPHREADIARIDLAGPVLDVLRWGSSPTTFDWFERPPADAIEAALALLRRLDAVNGDSLTPLGEKMNELPLHPRLARMLIKSGGARNVVRACALLSERYYTAPARVSSSSDLLSAVDDWHTAPPHVQRAAADIATRVSASIKGASSESAEESDFLRAVLAGYPDRVAQRREGDRDRLKLSSGTGALLARESGVRNGELLVALDVRKRASDVIRRGASEDGSFVRVASLVEREWLLPTRRETVHRYDEGSRSVRAAIVEWYDALMLTETPVRPDPDAAAALLADVWLRSPRSDEDARFLRRLTFAGIRIDVNGLVIDAARGATSLDAIDLRKALNHDVRSTLERDAPDTLVLPSGRSVRMEYSDDGTPGASAKLQELFGLADTPRLGPANTPVVLTLLAPNGRPVQVTRDLRSFWTRTYPDVRKELRGRYPRHPWPHDPWTATPTARTQRRPDAKKR